MSSLYITSFFLSRMYNEKIIAVLYISWNMLYRIDHLRNNSMNISTWKSQYLPWRLINNHGEPGTLWELQNFENKGYSSRVAVSQG